MLACSTLLYAILAFYYLSRVKRKTIHQYLVILLALSQLYSISAQTSLKPLPKPFLSVNESDILQLLTDARTSEDTMYYLLAQIDNLGGPEMHAFLLDNLTHFLAVNARTLIYNDEPLRLYKEAIDLWEKGERLQSIALQKRAVNAYDKQHRVFGPNSIFPCIRLHYNELNLPEERLAYYKEKLAYYQNYGPIENTADCYHAFGGYYLLKADYNLAISHYLKAASIFKTYNADGYANAHSVVGWTYYRWGNYDKSKYYLESGLALSKKTGNYSNVQLCYIFLGLIAKQDKQYSESMKLLDTALTLIVMPRDIDVYTLLLAEKGGLLLIENKPDEALPMLNRAIELRESEDLPLANYQGDFEGYFYLYQYFVMQKDWTKAEQILLMTYDKAGTSKSNRQILKLNKELAIFYNAQSKNIQALPYALAYITLSDSLRNIENTFNVSQYEEQQEAISNEVQVLGLEQEKKLQRNYFAGGGLMLLLLSAGIYSRLQYVRRVTKQLAEQNIQIEKAKLHAEQSERFKQEFLANMSHEIRTPMNAVMGMTSLLMDKKPRHDQVAYLTGIQKSSDTLLHIINDILDLSKVEAGKIDLEAIDFAIRQEMKQVKQLLDHKAIEKGIQLILHIDHNVPDVIIGDPVRLNQVLINLAGNAIKFTEKGSVTIEVGIGQGAGGKVQGVVGSSQPAVGNQQSAVDSVEFAPPENTQLLFKVSDTGIGIPKDKLDRVFESFSQAHSSDNRKFGGTGLGLSISKQLVELMGGTIAVESEEGSGTTFSFEIEYPIGSAAKLLETKSHDQMDGSMLNGLKILVVDDNEFNRTVARDTLLSKCDVEIIEAIHGQEAIDLLKEQDFDVILMDVQMPVMDGFEATRQIRETFPAPKNKTQIIALTASVVRSDLDKCRAAGMDDYVAKPFKAMQLLATIAKASGREIRHLENPVSAEMPGKIGLAELSEIPIKSVTDLTYLEKFCEGDTSRMNKYISMFLDTAPGLTEQITQALAQENYEEIAGQIHAYKTKWIMMGMTDAKDLALVIEQACRESGDTISIRKNVDSLLALIQTAVSELKV